MGEKEVGNNKLYGCDAPFKKGVEMTEKQLNKKMTKSRPRGKPLSEQWIVDTDKERIL